MKVFINKRVGNYSGGMVIVAANNVEEAKKILKEHLNGWFDSDYEKGGWLELPHVTSDYTIPTFIAEDGYSE